MRGINALTSNFSMGLLLQNLDAVPAAVAQTRLIGKPYQIMQARQLFDFKQLDMVVI